MSSTADVRVILDGWLEEKHRQRIQKRIEFDRVLRFPGGSPLRHKLLAQPILHVAQRHSVVNWQGQRLVETYTCGEKRIVAVDICRTPVIGEGSIQALCAVRLFFTIKRPRLPRIVRSTKLKNSGVALPGFHSIEGASGSRFSAGSEANLAHAHGRATELQDKAGGIM